MDILSQVAIRVPCPWCTEPYEVPLRAVLLAEEAGHEACAATPDTECPPVHEAGLLPHSAIKALEEIWQQLDAEAKATGGEIVLLKPRPSADEQEQQGRSTSREQANPLRRAP